MATYEALRDRALNQCNLAGQSEAQTVAQTALEEAMKFAAFHVRIPSLIATATATAPASPDLEANAITIEGGAGTFGVTSGVFQAPDRLYVRKDSDATSPGTPYEFMEYDHFQDIKNIAGGVRQGIMEPAALDEKPAHCYTITGNNAKIWALPLTEDNVLTLRYRKVPAAYSGAASPEILPMFDYILVNGAVVALKEWIREPEQITTLWALFEMHLMQDLQRYDLFLNGQRKRSNLRIHRSYRV